MKRILAVFAFMAIVSFAGSALAKDNSGDLSGFYSVQTEEWEQKVCKHGACEDFYTGQRVVSVKPMFLADSQVRQLKAEGKLVEGAPSKPVKPENIRQLKPAKAKVASAPKKRAHITKAKPRPKLVWDVPIPSDAECVTYKPSRGDNLTVIAKKFGAKTPAQINEIIVLIRGKNLIKNANLIREGAELKVPKALIIEQVLKSLTDNMSASASSNSAPITGATAPASVNTPVLAPVFAGMVLLT
jgi:hypothetical protein